MPEGTTLKTVEVRVNAFTEVVTETLANEGEVALTGFGSFKVSHRSERQGRNPKLVNQLRLLLKVPTFRPEKD